jgi:hypothetical protein
MFGAELILIECIGLGLLFSLYLAEGLGYMAGGACRAGVLRRYFLKTPGPGGDFGGQLPVDVLPEIFFPLRPDLRAQAAVDGGASGFHFLRAFASGLHLLS